jgi:hypothetical protein
MMASVAVSTTERKRASFSAIAASIFFCSETSRTIAVANVPSFVFHGAKLGSTGNAVPSFLRHSLKNGGT